MIIKVFIEDHRGLINTPINSDDLNSFYYRVNPFVSLTFALSKNIFKK